MNLLDLSDRPYPPASAAVTRICVTLPLQIADLGEMSHFVSARQRARLATPCTYTRSPIAGDQFRCFSNRKTYNGIGILVPISRRTFAGGTDVRGVKTRVLLKRRRYEREVNLDRSRASVKNNRENRGPEKPRSGKTKKKERRWISC